MATLNDVAREANVSPITVSRVMNNSTAVRPETRERVMAAVKKLNYQPNLLARGLSADRMDSIGVIVTHVENPMYSLMVSGIYSEAAEYGYDVILACSHDLDSSLQSVSTLINKRVSGLVILPVEYRMDKGNELGGTNNIKMMNEFARRFAGVVQSSAPGNFPVVSIGRQISDGVSGRIIENYSGGAMMAVDYLVKQGHRRIGFISHYDRTEGIWGERFSGYMRAMEKNQLQVRKNWIVYSDETVESAEKAMKEILDEEERPTAVYCANDVIAVGALNALAERGIRVPEEMSVIGHDGSSFGEMVRPALTTVAIYPVELGKKAVRLFMEVMKHESGADMILTPKVVERQSTARCRD